MPFKLFRTPAKPAACPHVPAGRRVYAIGDVHGRLDCLDALLDLVTAEIAAAPHLAHVIVFLGDLVDRGPDSRGVVERVRTLQLPNVRVITLKGNHEEIMLLAASGDRESAALFDRVGGRATLISYGVDPDTYDHATLGEIGALAKRHIPDDDIAFLDGLPDTHAEGDYLFVHAGVRPGRPLDEQRGSDLRWIRGDFLNHRGRHEAMIVHGHSPSDDPDVQDNRIGIDTRAYASGVLTALVLEGTEQRFLTGSPAPAQRAMATASR